MDVRLDMKSSQSSGQVIRCSFSHNAVYGFACWFGNHRLPFVACVVDVVIMRVDCINGVLGGWCPSVLWGLFGEVTPLSAPLLVICIVRRDNGSCLVGWHPLHWRRSNASTNATGKMMLVAIQGFVSIYLVGLWCSDVDLDRSKVLDANLILV